VTEVAKAGGRYLTRGQPSALEAVRRAVRSGSPPHAVLLVGPPQVGKTTLAMDLAAALLCLDEDADARPCRACAACRKVVHGNHPDLHRLAPEGAGDQIKLGQVQTLISELALMAMEGRFRIAVVEQAHRLNQDAQNALLKTLEEPPAGVVIVLTVDDEGLILPTVRSRCVRLRLGPVAPAVTAELLAERGVADAAGAATLSRLAGGRPGLALALAHEPEATLVHARLMRGLLDVLPLDRRARFDAIAGLLADATALDDATERGMRTAERAEAADQDAAPPPRRRSSARTAAASPSASPSRSKATAGATPGTARSSARATPVERRRAAMRVLSAWRDLARDLLVLADGGERHVRQVELLEELDAVAPRLDGAALVGFVAGLDVLTAAIEAYANPELVLDVLLLRWPRLAPAGAGGHVPRTDGHRADRSAA
jgi:DNA polymerase-3 subunit delta'